MALKIDNLVVHTTATETIMQNVEAFAAQSNGAIRVMSENIMGDMAETSIISEIASLIGRRDIGADTALTPKNIDSRDENNIKLYWGTGAIEFKMVDATRYGSDSGAFSVAIGEQIGKGIMQFMLNSAIKATRACIETVAALVTGDGTASATHALLNSSLKPFGDARQDVVCWIMNGATHNTLVGAAIASGGADVAYGAIYEGTTGTLGKPTFVTDSEGLDMTVGTSILGLTMDAIIATESAAREFLSEVVGGNSNLKYRIQGEGEFMLNIKGYSWKTASGVNPTQANVGTAANWEKKATDNKSTAGVLLNIA
jgi:hypothetical protein